MRKKTIKIRLNDTEYSQILKFIDSRFNTISGGIRIYLLNNIKREKMKKKGVDLLK